MLCSSETERYSTHTGGLGNMPSATFSLSGTDSRRNSGQSILDDSDYEDLGRNHESNDSSTRHYWLGKLVFAHLLAEAVIRDTPVQKSGDSLDVRRLDRIQKITC
jgi:hypothetical protein